jgi:hypothetical protein
MYEVNSHLFAQLLSGSFTKVLGHLLADKLTRRKTKIISPSKELE